MKQSLQEQKVFKDIDGAIQGALAPIQQEAIRRQQVREKQRQEELGRSQKEALSRLEQVTQKSLQPQPSSEDLRRRLRGLEETETFHVPENLKLDRAIRATRAGREQAGSALSPAADAGSGPEPTAAGGGGHFGYSEPNDDGDARRIELPGSADGLDEAVSLLREVPTGRRLLALAARGKVEFDAADNFGAAVLFDPEANRLRFDPKLCRDRSHVNAAELAGLLAHELQHAAQALDSLPPGRKKLEYESHAVAQIVLDELGRGKKAPAEPRGWLKDEQQAWARGPGSLEHLARERYAEKAAGLVPPFYASHFIQPSKQCRDGLAPSRPMRCWYSLEELAAIDARYDAFKKAAEAERLKRGKGGR